MKKTSRARKNRDAFAHYLLRPRWSRKPAMENINEELEDNDSDGRPTSGHYRIRPGSRGTARESVSAARRHARDPRRGGRFGQPDSGGRAREQVVCARRFRSRKRGGVQTESRRFPVPGHRRTMPVHRPRYRNGAQRARRHRRSIRCRGGGPGSHARSAQGAREGESRFARDFGANETGGRAALRRTPQSCRLSAFSGGSVWGCLPCRAGNSARRRLQPALAAPQSNLTTTPAIRRAARRWLCYAGSTPVLQMPDARTVTLLLRDLAGGDQGALDRLVPLVYEELRRIAEGQLRRERPGHTLQPTALVHEVYVRMVGQEQAGYQDRAHFLAIAAHAMRRILIDHAREHNAAKRGGGQEKFAIDEERDGSMERPSILIALDDALAALAGKDPLLARLVEMRYFGGLTAEESSTALNLEIKVVRRQLRLAEAWLQREMDHPAPGSQSAPAN